MLLLLLSIAKAKEKYLCVCVHMHTFRHITKICNKNEVRCTELFSWSDLILCFVICRDLGRTLRFPFLPTARPCLICIVSMCPIDNHTESWKTTPVRIPGPHRSCLGSRSQLWAGKSQLLRKRETSSGFSDFSLWPGSTPGEKIMQILQSTLRSC